MITFLRIQFYFAVHHLQCILSAGFHTHTTGNTVVFLIFDVHAAFDSNIVFFCFQAVILASCNTKFEFMREFPSEISLIKLFCQCVGVDTSAWTDL